MNRKISLQEKIGQMILIGFSGIQLEPDSILAEDIQTGRIGGIVLFDKDIQTGGERNIVSADQVASLISSIKEMSALLPIVSIDQEGGYVSRLKPKNGFPEIPSAARLGSLNDPIKTRSIAATTAATLSRCGFNLNLAPCVDLNRNPDNPVIGRLDRSFSADPEAVTRHAGFFIDAHHDRGLKCCLKHFPGHGSSSTDSHLGLVDVTSSWSGTELIPYRSLIKAKKADAVMTAHIFHRDFDSHYPATLSPAILNGILREQLGFDGLIISDDMQMQAITVHYGAEEATKAAVLAGCDILTFGNNLKYDPSVAEKTINTLVNLIDSGKISVGRIEESFERISRFKADLL